MSMFTKLAALYENYAKHETLKQLRSMPERQLEDLGFSMLLINKGVEAWPWREEDDDLQPVQLDAVSSLEAINAPASSLTGTKELTRPKTGLKESQRTAA